MGLECGKFLPSAVTYQIGCFSSTTYFVWRKELSKNFKGKHCKKKLLIEKRFLAFIIKTNERKMYASVFGIFFPKKAITRQT